MALEKRSLVWLSGVRRVGKTTLCASLGDAVRLDCELPSSRLRLEDPEFFWRTVAKTIWHGENWNYGSLPRLHPIGTRSFRRALIMKNAACLADSLPF
ncbi:hypothetical protein EBR21_09175 [bacterium]|nr:hypothetical protein [bacterium]